MARAARGQRVCGIVATAGSPESRADAIVMALRHRGPDSFGSVSMATCGLAMARLAIMDPDPRADQPMEFAGATLVYNGEIYNFTSLRHHLEQRGHRFITTGDTEVLLHAVVEWGAAGACERLEGMFAFAVWDDRSHSLHLARDSFGIKPLYWLGDGGGLVAASEVTPLAAAFGLRPRPDAIREFLRFGSPVTDVAYERVAELEPGTILTWHDHTVRVHPFAAPSSNGATPAEAACSSIARQLRSDRPTALFLSGGFDSALLAAVAARTGAPVSALTLSTGDNVDDVRLAAETARHYGLVHEVVRVEEADLARSADEFLGALDQPTIDGFNTFLVARAAVDRGFPVALSGLGGDETLGGYGYSRRLRQVRRARRVWDRLPPVCGEARSARLPPGSVSPRRGSSRSSTHAPWLRHGRPGGGSSTTTRSAGSRARWPTRHRGGSPTPTTRIVRNSDTSTSASTFGPRCCATPTSSRWRAASRSGCRCSTPRSSSRPSMRNHQARPRAPDGRRAAVDAAPAPASVLSRCHGRVGFRSSSRTTCWPPALPSPR